MQAEFHWGPRTETAARPSPVKEAPSRRAGTESFAAALCSNYQDPAEIEALCYELAAQLGGQNPDLALVFASAPENPNFQDILPILHRYLDPQILVGCSGSGVIGSGEELEYGQSLSVLAAKCDTSNLHPFAFDNESACGKDATPESLAETIGTDPAEYENGLMLIFIDPLTISTEYALSMIDSVFPSVMKFGALVSGSHEFRKNRTMFGDQLLDQGAVGLLMKQNFVAETVVSGSEEPVGPEMVITGCSRNEIQTLDDRSPMSVLEEIFINADPLKKVRMKRNLVVGLESSGLMMEPDYVMRNIMDMDQDTGAMTIGDLVEEGQKLRFHVRDSELASQRLTQNLDKFAQIARTGGNNIDAMLCFNSVARGSNMFEVENHDAKLIAERFGNIPIAGFFSNGEVVSKRGGFALTGEEEYSTRVMGYSDTLVMLRDAQRTKPRQMAGHAAESSRRY